MQKQKLNLLVFITPKIVRNAEDNASVVNQKINERIEFIQRNMDGKDAHGQYIDEMPRRGSAKSSEPASTPEPITRPGGGETEQMKESEPPSPSEKIEAPPPNQEEPAIETF